MNARFSSLVLLASIALAPTAAHATVGVATQTWYVTYVQNSNAQPVAASSSSAVALMVYDSDADMLSATWSGPNGPLPDFIITPSLAITYSSDYGSQVGNFLADYPAGSYVFSATSGPLNGLFAQLNATPHDFPAQTPFFTGLTYTSAQLCPASGALNVSWNAWSSPAAGHDKSTTLSVVGYTVPGDNYSLITPNTTTSATIPGSALSSGRHYFMEVAFQSAKSAGNTGFGNTVPVSWGFNKRTYFQFSVDAAPGTVAGQLTLANFNRPAGELIDWEVINTADVVLDSGTMALGYDNWYAFNTTAVGNYRVRFKGRHWLSKVSSVQPIAAGVNFLNLTLTNGDVNGDNIVDIADYTRLALAFDAQPGDPNYDEPADLDGSSLVDIADYSYLAAGFDQVGE